MRNSTKTYQLISETFLQIINEQDRRIDIHSDTDWHPDDFHNVKDPEMKEKLRRLLIRNKAREAQKEIDTLGDALSPEQRQAWRDDDTDSPNYPQHYRDAFQKDHAIGRNLHAAGSLDYQEKREKEAEKRKNDPIYDAMVRMRQDQRAIDRASDALIASDGFGVTVDQEAKDKAFQDSLRYLGGPRRYIDDPSFSTQGYTTRMRRLGYENDPYTGQPVKPSVYSGSSDEYLQFIGEPPNEPLDPSPFPRGKIETPWNNPANTQSRGPSPQMTSPATLQDRKRFEDRPNYSGYFA